MWCNDQARYATGGTNAACAVQGIHLFLFDTLSFSFLLLILLIFYCRIPLPVLCAMFGHMVDDSVVSHVLSYCHQCMPPNHIFVY